MESIIPITGKVKYQITLDPSVWIFDDRKVDMNTYFDRQEKVEMNDLEEYTKSVSEHWDREIMEGAIFPPTLKTEKKFLKQQLIEGTFGIPLAPFIKNAKPDDDANMVVFKQTDGETEMSLDQAKELILGFSKDGKPLLEDGPVYVYYGDGSNLQQPIKGIKSIMIK